MNEAFDLIRLERDRQADLWGREHSWGHGDCSSQDVPDPVKATVLVEEVGEVARAMLDGDSLAMRRELIQVAAVAVAWWEALAS